MRGTDILVLAAALSLAMTGDGAAQSDRTLSLGNRTCGALMLTFEGEAPCEAYSTGCKLPLDTDQVWDVGLKNSDAKSIVEVKVEGSCPGRPATTIAGRCTFDLDRMFARRVSSNYADWPVVTVGLSTHADVLGNPYNFGGDFPGARPDDASVAPSAAAVDIALADCEASGDGATRVCAASCRSHAR